MIALLGVATREVSISRLLAATLEVCTDQRDGLLAALAPRSMLATKPDRLAVLTEVALRGAGRIDLLVAWACSGTGHVLVVEHKLYANEGTEQLVRYRAAEESICVIAAEALTRVGAAISDWAPVQWTMLTLFGDAPSDSNFDAVAHRSLVEHLSSCEGPAPAAALARDWASLLRDFYSAGETCRSKTFAAAFAPRAFDPLDARYLMFTRFVRDVGDASGLEDHGTYRANYSGRHWFGGHLSQPIWYPDTATLGAPCNLDRDWWIALQIRFEMPLHDPESAGRLVLGVFFETLPYLSQRDFERLPTTDCAKARYKSRRSEFTVALTHTLARDRWSIAGDWCQVAKAVAHIELTLPWTEVVEHVATLVKEAAASINAALAEPGRP